MIPGGSGPAVPSSPGATRCLSRTTAARLKGHRAGSSVGPEARAAALPEQSFAMTLVRFISHVLIPSILLAAVGCDGATGPDLGDFDPEELALALNEMVAPLDATTEASTNLNAAIPDLRGAGIVFSRSAPELRALRAAPRVDGLDGILEARVPLLPVQFPPEVIGQTFAFVLAAQAWRVDETRSDEGPVDGVRVLWYDLDGTGSIEVPLDEQGLIDLRSRSGEDSDSLVMTVVEVRDGNRTTLLDFVQGRETTAAEVRSETFRAEGFYSNGISDIPFLITSTESEDTGTGDVEYALAVSLEDPETSYTVGTEGSVDGATAAFEDRLRAEAVRGGATTVLNLVFSGVGNSQEEASGTLERDGALIANVDIEGNSFEFSTPDGGSFSTSQATELRALFRAMTLSGLTVLVNLPLFLP